MTNERSGSCRFEWKISGPTALSGAAVLLAVSWGVGARALLRSPYSLFADGVIAAVYIAMFYAWRGRMGVGIAAALVPVSALHVLWCPLLSVSVCTGVESLLHRSVQIPYFAATGVVYAAALGLASGRWWVAIVALGIGAAVESVHQLGWRPWRMGTSLDDGIAILHCALAVVLAIDSLPHLVQGPADGRPVRRCAACGYELQGLRGGVCPECGEAAG